MVTALVKAVKEVEGTGSAPGAWMAGLQREVREKEHQGALARLEACAAPGRGGEGGAGHGFQRGRAGLGAPGEILLICLANQREKIQPGETDWRFINLVLFESYEREGHEQRSTCRKKIDRKGPQREFWETRGAGSGNKDGKPSQSSTQRGGGKTRRVVFRLKHL